MDVGSVMEAWDDVETEAESEDSDASDRSAESVADVAGQDFADETSDEEDNTVLATAPATAPGPSTVTHSSTRSTRPVEYDWQEITDGKDQQA